MTKRRAFTLAEILIVLAIIGVVATLTLPGLLMSYRDRTYVAQLQRTYNSLSNAATAQMLADDVDDLSKSSMTNSKGIEEFIRNNLKVSNDCGSNTGDCFAGDYSDFNKSTTKSAYDLSSWPGSDKRCYLLNTGASICMGPMSQNGYANIMIDTNGQAGPNVNGLDLFRLSMDKYGNMSSTGGTSGFEYGFFEYIRRHGWVMYK